MHLLVQIVELLRAALRQTRRPSGNVLEQIPKKKLHLLQAKICQLEAQLVAKKEELEQLNGDHGQLDNVEV